MSSYGSNKSSGFLHPQYQPQHQAPPYPTTPDPTSQGGQQSPFYPPTPQPQQPTYSSSPSSQPSSMAMIAQDRRRSSSSSSYRPSMPTIPQQSHEHRRSSSSYSYRPSMPMQIPMRRPNPSDYHPSSSYPP